MRIMPNQIPAHRTAGEAWQWAMGIISNFGDNIKTEDGKLTREIQNLQITILEPSEGWPIKGSGWNMDGLNQYAGQLLNPKNQGFDYTYGERLFAYAGSDYNQVNQICYAIGKLKEHPTTRRAIAITWWPFIDNQRKHVPCLQIVEFLYRRDKLHLTAYFRSWDVKQAAPANIYGLNRLLQWTANETEMQPGSITIIAGSAHIYQD